MKVDDNYPNTAHRALKNTTEDDCNEKTITFGCSFDLLWLFKFSTADTTVTNTTVTIASLVLLAELKTSVADLAVVLLLTISIATWLLMEGR